MVFNKVLVDTYNYLKNNSLLARSVLGTNDLDAANMRLLHSSRQEIDTKSVIPNPNPNPDTTPFFVTSDSYLIVSIKPDGANKGAGVNLEFSELI